MESNSERNRVQMSDATAALLRAAGKSHWFVKREDLIEAKGKGAMQCYWLSMDASTTESVAEKESSIDEDEEPQDDDSLDGAAIFEKEKRLSRKHERLVDWNTTCLFQLIKQIRKDDAEPQDLEVVRQELRQFVYSIALKYVLVERPLVLMARMPSQFLCLSHFFRHSTQLQQFALPQFPTRKSRDDECHQATRSHL